MDTFTLKGLIWGAVFAVAFISVPFFFLTLAALALFGINVYTL